MSNPNYKFQHVKVYGNSEYLYQNMKQYRRVYDVAECTYLYAELALFNKLFDEGNWNATARFKCFNVEDESEVCDVTKAIKASKTDNIVYAREGWGTEKPGWWKKGHYRWDAFVDEEKVGSAEFFVEDKGVVTPNSNPHLSLNHVKMFECGDDDYPSLGTRTYYKSFAKANTRYIYVELNVTLADATRPTPLEFTFNYYNDAGQFKATTDYYHIWKKEESTITIDAGYGAATGNYWFEDNYTLEIIYMGQRIAIVPFSVGADFVEHEGSLPFDVDSRVTTTGSTKEKKPKVEKKKMTFEQATGELSKLIGLSTVKKQLEEFSTYLQFLQIRKKKGFEESGKFNMHAVFTGNPGTGKTTVAKMLGNIYHSLDLLSKGHVHEVGRAELVGEYIGQTAPRVKKAIDKARGGILFVDEAYSLTDRGGDEGGGANDFGKEVVETLIKEMSDGQGDIAIIFAGYPEKMQQFLNSNAGISSRISSIISFPDYNPNELMLIADFAAQQKTVVISEKAKEFIHRQLVEVYRNRDKNFGNARYIHGIIEECKENMALRLMKSTDIENLTREELSTVELPDAEKAFGINSNSRVDIPVDELQLAEALKELHALTGMDNIKREVEEMSKLVRYYTEIGKDVRKAFSLHTVFTGNPGTGKTTVARIIVKIYKALGVLERGHLVEVDRKNLVAAFSGQTAIKTAELIAAAKGGGLFIDEAYSLVNGPHDDFGREAINVLLKEMEDKRGEFMVIIAGYSEPIKLFLESNPGLMSRFDKTLHFEDYNVADLMEIANDMLEVEHLKLDAEATTALEKHIGLLLENKHQYFGNARTVRKIVKEIARRQNLRLASLEPAARTPEMVELVSIVDVTDLHLVDQNMSGDGRKRIGF